MIKILTLVKALFLIARVWRATNLHSEYNNYWKYGGAHLEVWGDITMSRTLSSVKSKANYITNTNRWVGIGREWRERKKTDCMFGYLRYQEFYFCLCYGGLDGTWKLNYFISKFWLVYLRISLLSSQVWRGFFSQKVHTFSRISQTIIVFC